MLRYPDECQAYVPWAPIHRSECSGDTTARAARLIAWFVLSARAPPLLSGLYVEPDSAKQQQLNDMNAPRARWMLDELQEALDDDEP